MGGKILTNIIKQTGDNGIVTSMGMVNDTVFKTNVLPFILRAVRLVGINTEMLPASGRIDLINQSDYRLNTNFG